MRSESENEILAPEILLVTNLIHQEECVPEDEEPDEPGCKPRKKPPVKNFLLRECDPSCGPSSCIPEDGPCRPVSSCRPDD